MISLVFHRTEKAEKELFPWKNATEKEISALKSEIKHLNARIYEMERENQDIKSLIRTFNSLLSILEERPQKSP